MENKIKELMEAGYSIEDIAEVYKQEEKKMRAAAAAKEREAKIDAAKEVLARAMSDYFNLALDMHLTVEECAAMVQDITRQAKAYFRIIPNEVTKAESNRAEDELDKWLRSIGL